MLQILTIINLAAALQGLFLSYLLINKKAGSKEYLLLALVVLTFSVAMLGAVLGLSGYYRVLPHFIRVGDPLVLLFGPLLYYYVHFLTRGRLPKKYGLHLLPFFLYVVSLIPFYALTGEEKIAFVDRVFFDTGNNLQVALIQLIRIVHIIVYVIISLILMGRFETFLKDNYSDIDKLKLDKAALLLKLFVVICVFRLAVYGLGIFVPLNFVLTNSIVGLVMSLVIYVLAYAVWNRHTIVTIPGAPTKLNPPAIDPVNTESPRPALSGENKTRAYYLSDDQVNALSPRLEKLLIQDKIYLENELSLSQLSERLEIPAYQTSELINRTRKEPFFDLINRHRVEEIKRRLEDAAYRHFSILGIAMDCGFNSKSSFNAAFKKFTGKTPSEFKPK